MITDLDADYSSEIMENNIHRKADLPQHLHLMQEKGVVLPRGLHTGLVAQSPAVPNLSRAPTS